MTNPRIHDITMPLHARLPGWPGDVPFAFRQTWTQAPGGSAATGGSVNVGAFETSVHAGTHADAPFHVDPLGPTVDDLPLDAFVGPAVLLDVGDATRGGADAITTEHLERAAATLGTETLQALLARAPRLLLRTGSWPDRTRWPERIATLTPAAAAALATMKVRLLGVDVPSVDPLESKTLPVHHALNRGDVAILENLALDGVLPGVYELTALPLKIVGGDGAPVRAVLVER